MIVAIADIHGYYDKLTKLLDSLFGRYDPNETTYVFLGDYIDGGDKSKDVVEDLITMSYQYPHWQFLMGNHEDLLLNAVGYAPSLCSPYVTPDDFHLWYYQGGQETAQSYGYKGLVYPELVKHVFPKEHLEWLRTRPLHYETDHFTFVHAGLLPEKTAEETNAYHKLWIRDRFIHSSFPWDKFIVFGHTYNSHPVIMSNKMGIDTMHHGGGLLTAVALNAEALDNGEKVWYDFIRV